MGGCDLKRKRISSSALAGHIEPTTEGSWETQLKAPSGEVDVYLSIDLPSYKLLGLPIPALSIPLRLHSLADIGPDGVILSFQASKNRSIVGPELSQLAFKKDASATRLLEEQPEDTTNKWEEKTKMVEEVSKKLKE